MTVEIHFVRANHNFGANGVKKSRSMSGGGGVVRIGAPGWIRTSGLSLRRRTLYPTELRERVTISDCGFRIVDCQGFESPRRTLPHHPVSRDHPADEASAPLLRQGGELRETPKGRTQNDGTRYLRVVIYQRLDVVPVELLTAL
jgi:hypothetical protein